MSAILYCVWCEQNPREQGSSYCSVNCRRDHGAHLGFTGCDFCGREVPRDQGVHTQDGEFCSVICAGNFVPGLVVTNLCIEHDCNNPAAPGELCAECAAKGGDSVGRAMHHGEELPVDVLWCDSCGRPNHLHVRTETAGLLCPYPFSGSFRPLSKAGAR